MSMVAVSTPAARENGTAFDEVRVQAARILALSGVARGVCLELEGGEGRLGLALAAISPLQVCLLNRSEHMRRSAERVIDEQALTGRAVSRCGDPCAIPLRSGSVQLVVSSAVGGFGRDLVQVLREIRRVLAPYGYACIGGGLGGFDLTAYLPALVKADMADAGLLADGSSTWVVYRKTSNSMAGRVALHCATACDYK